MPAERPRSSLVVDDADAAHAAIVAAVRLPGYHDLDESALRSRWAAGDSLARITPVEDKPWGMREFALADADNNLLRVGENIRQPNHGPASGEG